MHGYSLAEKIFFHLDIFIIVIIIKRNMKRNVSLDTIKAVCCINSNNKACRGMSVRQYSSPMLCRIVFYFIQCNTPHITRLHCISSKHLESRLKETSMLLNSINITMTLKECGKLPDPL